MARLPLFPLGTVLIPTAVLPLHVFEPRYRTLMHDLAVEAHTPVPPVGAEFGVVLIRRGPEVGGGDERMPVGTVARLLEANWLPDGRWVLAVVGTRRFRVEQWLPEDPYPIGEVTDIEDGTDLGPGADELLAQTERRVRRALALVAEAGESHVPVTFQLADDPLAATWQLAALAPVGPLDRQRLLELSDPRERLRQTSRMAEDAADLLALRLGGAE